MNKRHEYFRIQGDWDTVENQALYWDNNTYTWVDFDQATIFEAKDLYHINLPIAPHDIQIVWVEANGVFVERDDLSTAFGRSEAMEFAPLGKKCLTCLKKCGKVVAS